jgi:hypothetical protein
VTTHPGRPKPCYVTEVVVFWDGGALILYWKRRSRETRTVGSMFDVEGSRAGLSGCNL